MNEKTLTLTESQAESLMQYLYSRPYREVFQIIMMLQQSFAEQNKEEE